MYLLIDNVVTGYNKEPISAILFFWRASFRAEIVFHFSDLGRISVQSVVLHGELVISNSAFDNRCACWFKMSQRSKRPRLLQASEVSELIVDTDSDKTGVSSDVSSVEGGTENVPGLSQPQPYHQTASSHKFSSSISSSASDEEDDSESGPGEQIQQAVTLHWTPPLALRAV